MKETVNVTIRIDKDVKDKAEILLNELGMNMTTAINVFLKQAIRVNGLPFVVSANIKNKEIPLIEDQDLDDLF